MSYYFKGDFNIILNTKSTKYNYTRFDMVDSLLFEVKKAILVKNYFPNTKSIDFYSRNSFDFAISSGILVLST